MMVSSKVGLVIFGLFIVYCNAELSDEVKAQIKAKLDECKMVEGVSDDDITVFLSGELPKTFEGKCLISCLQESFGLTKGGQVQNDGAYKLGKKLFGDNEQVLSAIQTVHDTCGSLSDPDRCEAAVKRMTCAKETAKKLGLAVPREMV